MPGNDFRIVDCCVNCKYRRYGACTLKEKPPEPVAKKQFAQWWEDNHCVDCGICNQYERRIEDESTMGRDRTNSFDSEIS